MNLSTEKVKEEIKNGWIFRKGLGETRAGQLKQVAVEKKPFFFMGELEKHLAVL